MVKPCIRSGDHHVACESEIEPSARAGTVDGGNCGRGESLDSLDCLPTESGIGHARIFIEHCNLTEMRTGEKNVRVGRAKDKRFGVVICREASAGCRELLESVDRKDCGKEGQHDGSGGLLDANRFRDAVVPDHSQVLARRQAPIEGECTQRPFRFLSNTPVKPALGGCRQGDLDFRQRFLAVGEEDFGAFPFQFTGNFLARWQNPTEGKHPELAVSDDCIRGRRIQQRVQTSDAEAEGLFRRFGGWTKRRQKLGDNRRSCRPSKLTGQRVRTPQQVEVAIGSKLGLRAMKQPDMNQRKDLGGCRRRRFPASRSSQYAALHSGATGQYGQYQVAVSVRMVIEHQSFVFNGRHAHMVSER
jgi:hypothetical protein